MRKEGHSAGLGCRFLELGVSSVPAVVALEKTCFPSHWPEDVYAQALATGGCHLFGALRDGRLLAYIAVGLPVNTEEMEIYNLAVALSERRQGLARRLLAAALTLADAAACARTVLEVRSSNAAAISLYESMGFLQAGARPRYYADTGEDALVYARKSSAGTA